ncbi:hypothetical protein QLQ15_03425 [Lysobacter sp. LF1]|uniref:SoxR reducing system RseC family protein n=1 Tax=Lysobacter stagni TaxID=3045172 RepID=A0ABT6XCU1_9GAMM|nr:hypothetical protein [Lysobacter sp. LF1]MDI9237954.1 hypothetical protein [Lysobacter sp. LF1]
MSTVNPMGPRARLDAALAEVVADCWRDGNQLVVRPGCTLPGRCIKCNEPALQLKSRSFYWHHPALYALALLLPLYAIVALFVRKKTPVTVGLCGRHRSQRRLSLAVGMVGSVIGLGMLFVAAADEVVPLALAGGAVIVASQLVAILGGRVLVVTRIGENYTRFDGSSPDFLATLPTFYRTK